ncbi:MULTISPECIES: TRM11 family SAM-dependent methyltransferase [Prauserella salsuginis group]|uniref:Methyltransferase n=1 Tax=Prauserella salsuginis TaxID=387889 RepID=A0ABW6FZY3_9PSEU|nr:MULTISPECIES: DNA methyltransferase [Prauserella salsuginis group]MCR3721113.1 DNA methylase [Prauserella flava]MCR3734807.1 DNA methylase [Prauserella salsuginis]
MTPQPPNERAQTSDAHTDEATMPIPRTLNDTLDANPADDNAPGAAELPVSVWTTAQTSPANQRKGRYVAGTTAHPAKMLPAVAAHAIEHYTRPGEIVFDPMAGAGTTLVEALHAGRRALAVEYEPHWAAIAQANLELARERGHNADAQVVHGDARQLPHLLPEEYHGQAALVVTSPPYGPSTHGRVATASTDSADGKVHKYYHRYGNTLDRGNLANVGHHRLLSGFTRILAGAATILRPGGHVAITVRPWREHAELIDLPSQIIACGHAAGLEPVERCVALLARVANDTLIARGSFFQRDFIRKQREQGLPLHLISHEDVIVLAKPPRAPQHVAQRGGAEE